MRSRTSFRRLALRVVPILGLAALGPAVAQHDPIGSLLIPPLEKRFGAVVPPVGHPIAGIIALGGSERRVVEAVALAQQFPEAKLIIAGAGEDRSHAYARSHGTAPDRLVFETTSLTTYENAVFTQRLLEPRADQRWVLVTSASHMPRAIGCFRKAGFTVLPWPVMTDPELAPARVARHEWLGLIVYRLLGRTDSLFPAPQPQEVPDPRASSPPAG